MMNIFVLFSIQYGLESCFALTFAILGYQKLDKEIAKHWVRVKTLIFYIMMSALVGLLSTMLNFWQFIAGVYVPNWVWFVHDFFQVYCLVHMLARTKSRSSSSDQAKSSSSQSDRSSHHSHRSTPNRWNGSEDDAKVTLVSTDTAVFHTNTLAETPDFQDSNLSTSLLQHSNSGNT